MTPADTKTAHYKSDLRRLTAAVGVALVLFGVLLLAVVAFAGWSANRTSLVRERQLVENALDESVSRVLDQQKAIAWWDDAVSNVQARPMDREWVDTNIGLYFYETYSHDEVIIVDQHNRPVYATVDGEFSDVAEAYAKHRTVFDMIVAEARNGAGGNLRDRDQIFSQSQGNYQALLGASFGRWSGHIMRVDGVPAVVAAISIVPNIDAGLLRGREPHLLLSVVKIDEAFVGGVGASLLIPDLAVSASAAPDSGRVVEAFVADDGAPLGQISWTPRKPGQLLLVIILPLVALGVIGVGMLTWSMIARLKRASVDLADREEHSRHQALHDALSGLPNRHHFADRLQQGLDHMVQTRNGLRVNVAYIDVDRFKDVNDTLGHQAGDALIMAVAKRLRGAIGVGDFLARFGGDEFAVMHVGDEKSALELGERMTKSFEENFDLYGQSIRMTASIGMARAPEHGDTPHDLMRNADIALYQAKGKGRDRAMFFCAEMAAEVEQRRKIEVDLIEALARQELTLHYQPLIASATNRIKGAEALLRWRHPTRGDISPGIFVPVAEEAGLMPALGAFVLARAFSEAKKWPDIEVSINLSPVQFRHMDLIGLLAGLLAEHDLDPGRIVLEVTEGVLLESSDRNRQVLEEIRALGFKLALDDFGTGYSSMRYLCDFRFDKIKIDRAFVSRVDERKRALTIIQSVVTLGRGLGMDIVAEGVETEAEAAVMRLIGVSELQGFYFSRAVPAADFDGLLERFNRSAPELPAPEAKPALRRARAASARG